MDPSDVARLAADALYEQKAEAIQILDVDRILVITSYFVIATGHTPKHLQGLADTVSKALRDRGVRRLSQEGYDEAQWVLLDFGDVIVHLFDAASRPRYDLEAIWADAPKLAWSPPAPPPPSEHAPSPDGGAA